MSKQTCPECGRPEVSSRAPSFRRFFACGSYMYDGDTTLRDRTDLCESVEASEAAARVLDVIRRDPLDASRQAETWLRAYAPQFLVEAKR